MTTVHAPTGDAMAEDVTQAQRRADALALLAESALHPSAHTTRAGGPGLAANFDGGTAGDRYQVVLHVTTSEAGDRTAESGVDQAAPAAVPAPVSADDAFDGALEVDHGAVHVSMETSQRLACDASLVHMHHAPDGTVLAVSHKTRTIPPSIRRALAARDTGCRFPGCTSRRCDAHHVEHWSDGGATRLDNLVLLCRRHHRAVHEGGFGIIRGHDGLLTFLRPDGAPLEVAPASPRYLPALCDATPHVIGTPPIWDGAPFDLPWAIDVLYRPGVPDSTV